MNFFDICCGIGGIAKGFNNAGWKELGGIDTDVDAIKINNLSGSKGEVRSVFDLHHADIVEADVLSAGFPCQPFSSSGNRSGNLHPSGNIVEKIISLVESAKTKVLVLENVQGLLSNKNGHTFASILSLLNDAGYDVAWKLVNSLQYDVLQERKRILIVAFRRDLYPDRILSLGDDESICRTLYQDVFSETCSGAGLSKNSLLGVITDSQPRIGKPATNQYFFKPSGIAFSGNTVTWKEKEAVNLPKGHVGDLVAPNFPKSDHIRSVRYWGHSGKTLPYFKKESISHCLGTTIGAGPTFGVENRYIDSSSSRDLVLENANWVREEPNHLVFRVNPITACKLFGPTFSHFGECFSESNIANTKLYRLLGNSVIPEKFQSIAQNLELNGYLEP